jgi:hypothetical protein
MQGLPPHIPFQRERTGFPGRPAEPLHARRHARKVHRSSARVRSAVLADEVFERRWRARARLRSGPQDPRQRGASPTAYVEMALASGQSAE